MPRTQTIFIVRHGHSKANEEAIKAAKAAGLPATEDRAILSGEHGEQIRQQASSAMNLIFDAPLTAGGIEQGTKLGERGSMFPGLEVVVSSTLPRAMATAQLGAGKLVPGLSSPQITCTGLWREYTGGSLSEKRRSVTELRQIFGTGLFDFSGVSEADEMWVGDMTEARVAAKPRANQALRFLWDLPFSAIAVLTHTGFLVNDVLEHHPIFWGSRSLNRGSNFFLLLGTRFRTTFLEGLLRWRTR